MENREKRKHTVEKLTSVLKGMEKASFLKNGGERRKKLESRPKN